MGYKVYYECDCVGVVYGIVATPLTRGNGGIGSVTYWASFLQNVGFYEPDCMHPFQGKMYHSQHRASSTESEYQEIECMPPHDFQSIDING